jgi:hypothetical protein
MTDASTPTRLAERTRFLDKSRSYQNALGLCSVGFTKSGTGVAHHTHIRNMLSDHWQQGQYRTTDERDRSYAFHGAMQQVGTALY